VEAGPVWAWVVLLVRSVEARRATEGPEAEEAEEEQASVLVVGRALPELDPPESVLAPVPVRARAGPAEEAAVVAVAAPVDPVEGRAVRVAGIRVDRAAGKDSRQLDREPWRPQ